MFYFPKTLKAFWINLIKYKKIMIFSTKRLCIHEAGHIIIAKTNPPTGLKKIVAELSDELMNPGKTRLFGKINLEDKHTALVVIKILLSGRFAEKMFFLFPSTLAAMDLETARELWERKIKNGSSQWEEFYASLEKEISEILNEKKAELKKISRRLSKERKITWDYSYANT